PTSRFGEIFQYSNLMATAAGYVGASVVSPRQELGDAYDEVMRSKVFGPLGMVHTTFDFATALSGQFCKPPRRRRGRQDHTSAYGHELLGGTYSPGWGDVDQCPRSIEIRTDGTCTR